MINYNLNPQEKAFCDALLADPKRDPEKAKKKAEYAAGHDVRDLLERPHVQDYLVFKDEERSRRLKIDADYVVSHTVEIIERCMQHRAVTDKKGNFLGEYQFDGKTAMTGLQHLGKHTGGFVEHQKIDVNAELGVRRVYELPKKKKIGEPVSYAIEEKEKTEKKDGNPT